MGPPVHDRFTRGIAVASEAAGPADRSRLLGVVIGGLTLANVIGVPLGSFAGQLAGWRGPSVSWLAAPSLRPH
jgi:predicted MFS family arabinose efflux permease